MCLSIASPSFYSRKCAFFVRALSTSSNKHADKKKIAVIGGGASGIFASIAAAEHSHTQVTVLEATGKTLQKVKISGGGRCNVMHDTDKSIQTILGSYPRGSKELNGAYRKRFTPAMARDWFEYRGVELKTEADGRMFPTTDSSQTILDTLMNAAEEEGVEIRTKQKVASITPYDNGFLVGWKDAEEPPEEFEAIILATGSAPVGYGLAKSLGHDLVQPAPSLFTLNCKHAIKEDGLLYGLSGISVPTARITLSMTTISGGETNNISDPSKKVKKKKKTTKLQQEGPLLITHHGLSGPAALRLSAFAAREFQEINYRTHITVHWDTGIGSNAEEVFEKLWQVTSSNPKRTVSSLCPIPNNQIPRRLWSALVEYSGLGSNDSNPNGILWGGAPKKLVRKLATNLVACPLEVTGKGTFKEEFVTAGGVSLEELEMKTMESKKCPGVFLCGELINVDGVTGGFNFMNCWATGFMAGHSSADYVHSSQ
ncbi:unnamed protein product [Cylindrotheca closterium]|uniref:FAD/NAD(P)-binding domain-containing protein n=1 Tax=Cylindrotheca closterium TaxID=2856 RepID=A0AAD2CPQ8_9STRA|nr:unnamed protein product [Cylindrotheca closterium]